MPQDLTRVSHELPFGFVWKCGIPGYPKTLVSIEKIIGYRYRSHECFTSKWLKHSNRKTRQSFPNFFHEHWNWCHQFRKTHPPASTGFGKQHSFFLSFTSPHVSCWVVCLFTLGPMRKKRSNAKRIRKLHPHVFSFVFPIKMVKYAKTKNNEICAHVKRTLY